MNMAEQMVLDDTAHFKQYERLLHDCARKCLTKAQALDPTMDTDELYGLFTEVYLACKAKFDPEKGYKFTTYLTGSIYNRFGNWCERTSKTRRVVSSMSVNSMVGDDDESSDAANAYSQQRDLGYGPDELADQKRQRKVMAERIIALKPRFRQVIAILMQGPGPELKASFHAHQAMLKTAGRHVPEEITIDFICHQMEFTRKEAFELREQLDRKFKVDVQSLNIRNFPAARHA